MALKEQINNDLKAALLERHRFVAETLRGLKAAILNEEVSSGKRDEGLSDAQIETIIVREVKKRNESKLLYEQNDRPELAENEANEAAVLVAYLPQQLTEDELRVIIAEVIAQIGAEGMQAMGQVIGGAKAKAGSAGDGATIARLVKETLQQ